MRRIPLTRGLFTLVDDEDYFRLKVHNWHALKGRHTYYACRHAVVDGKARLIYMHRAILRTPTGVQVDHIDRDGLNNTRDNLRECTGSENCRNRAKRRDNRSGYKGVYWSEKWRRWDASICVEGHRRFLGSFPDREAAAKAYDAAAMQWFGEFAWLNERCGR